MSTAGKTIWIWCVPVGIAVVIVAALVIGPYFIGNAATIRGTSAYKEAIRRVGAHPKVRQQLGNPIEAGSEVKGTLQINGQNGFADFTIPVTGPQGNGIIGVEAVLNGGTWSYQHLALQVEGSSESIIVEGQRPRLELPSAEAPSVSVATPEGEIADIPTGTSPPEEAAPTQETSPADAPESESPESKTPPTDSPKPEVPKAEPAENRESTEEEPLKSSS